ncbi:MAG: hypothetical protein ISR96_00015 [Nitrospira sp.]|nr:hypothetical protein [bacterium]MBL7047899.1 hypothetical protein [Nitrospira sp.]
MNDQYIMPNVILSVTNINTVSISQYNQYVSWLNEHEKKRMMQCELLIAQKRFVIARGILRDYLSLHMNCHPKDVHIEVQINGKPMLACRSFHFSISHSGNQVAIAISSSYPVGVDIECVKHGRDLLSLSDAVFLNNPDLELLSREQLTDWFYEKWTLFEAFLKVQEGESSLFSRNDQKKFTEIDSSNNCWYRQKKLPDQYYLSLVVNSNANASLQEIVLMDWNQSFSKSQVASRESSGQLGGGCASDI